MEFNLRRIAKDNMSFCADKCDVFQTLESTNIDEKKQFSCFEKCLGKFSDSYDIALRGFQTHLKSMNSQQVFQHSKADKELSEKKFLLGHGSMDPVYDKPTAFAQRECQEYLFQSFLDGNLIALSYQHSGGQLNELGDYQECRINEEYEYSLQLLKNDNVFKPKGAIYAIGNCFPKYCDSKSIQALNSIVYPQTLQRFVQQSQVTYTFPDKDYEKLKVQIPGLYVVLSFVFLITVLIILGVIVQHTSLGDLKEKNKFYKDDFKQKIGNNLHNYQKLIQFNDRFLVNKKKIWAIFFLCFSITRNTMILFYDMEKCRKVGYLRMIKVFAFFWVCFDFTFYWGFQSYPINFNDYPNVMSKPLSVMMISGVIFGIDLLFFYMAFQVMYEKLKTIHYRKVQYSPFLYILKTYLQYVIPIAFFIACVANIFPFIGNGPIFPHFIQEGVIQNCSNHWYSNILMIQNYFPWKVEEQCGPHLVYIDIEFQLLVILVPLFILISQQTYWQFQLGLVTVISIVMSIIPTIYFTYKYDISAFPGFLNSGYDYLYTRIWFRINPFLFGIALASIKFEYKYGSLYQQRIKSILSIIQQDNKKQWLCYILGTILMLFPIQILLTNTVCIQNQPVQIYEERRVSYCWGKALNIVYNVLCQFFFFSGLILFLLPTLIGKSIKLRSIMSSHLWHVLEELTFSAFLMSYMVISWYFTSRFSDILLSTGHLLMISMSAWTFSYMIALPFYLLVERPAKNFLDLVLFPRRAIFIKKKDLDTESSDDDDDSKATQKMKDTVLSSGKQEDENQFTFAQPNYKSSMSNENKISSNCKNCPIPLTSDMCKCNCKVENSECFCLHQKFKKKEKMVLNYQIQNKGSILTNHNQSQTDILRFASLTPSQYPTTEIISKTPKTQVKRVSFAEAIE